MPPSNACATASRAGSRRVATRSAKARHGTSTCSRRRASASSPRRKWPSAWSSERRSFLGVGLQHEGAPLLLELDERATRDTLERLDAALDQRLLELRARQCRRLVGD